LIPKQSGWTYDQIVQGIADEKIKGLWIIGTNSSHSWIHQRSFNEILKKLDFLVVQDMFHTTETAQQAHMVLPAAAWGEKEGTFINSERRIGLVKRISKSPGEALSDFNIFKLVAHYWGCAEMFTHWTSPEAVFQILKRLSMGRPCDFSGIHDYRAIDQASGIQWPAPAPESEFESERRLFGDGRFYHEDGKARFLFDPPRPMPEPPCKEFPYLLLTGRGTSAQWHTQTRTSKSDVLRRLYPENIYVEMNPTDAAALKIKSADRVEISSRRAQIQASAFVTYSVQPGQIFIPMHYNATNELTFPAFDPHSRQPAYKACAVAIKKLKK
jgi:assimilatory nitrate reductase catalytic subunit